MKGNLDRADWLVLHRQIQKITLELILKGEVKAEDTKINWSNYFQNHGRIAPQTEASRDFYISLIKGIGIDTGKPLRAWHGKETPRRAAQFYAGQEFDESTPEEILQGIGLHHPGTIDGYTVNSVDSLSQGGRIIKLELEDGFLQELIKSGKDGLQGLFGKFTFGKGWGAMALGQPKQPRTS